MGLLTGLNRALTLLLLAGSTLCLLFIVFSGAVNTFPFNQFYWLQVDTDNINDQISKWTMWGICNPTSWSAHKNGVCVDLAPAFPISPYDNFGNSTSLPTDFVDSRDTYYYLSRFGFSFLLIALVFSGVSFICAIFQCFWFAMKQVLTFFVTFAAIFSMAGVAMQTAVIVLTRNHFKDADYKTKLGASMLGITWGATACLMLVFFFACCSLTHKAYNIHKGHVEAAQQQQQQYYPAQPQLESQPQDKEAATGGGHFANFFHHSNNSTAPNNESVTGPVPDDTANLPPAGNETGIRFFKIKRHDKEVDQDSVV